MLRSRSKRSKRSPKARFPFARLILSLAVIALVAFAGWSWLASHPQHNPWAPLNLNDPIGMATARKLATLRDNVSECRGALERSEIAFTVLEQIGQDACTLSDRTQLIDYPLAPNTPAMTCPVATALEIWRRKSVEPAAREILGTELIRMEHMGVYNCRRMRGAGSSGAWSQHATANAIDISAFVFADGNRITVLDGWEGTEDEARFLHQIRTDACKVYSTVLSPDYNAAHADHFHFDQGSRWVGVCQ